jgi:CTP:molybdopterin cytidylyltransferase MocA
MNASNIYPVILAAGPSIRRLFPAGGLLTGGIENPFEVAAANCRGMRSPIFVLGYDAQRFARYVPATAKLVINRSWPAGQLSSLLAGLRRVPRSAPFMLYPADLIYLSPSVIAKILRAFAHRPRDKEIFMPRSYGRGGHPVIFSAKLRDELRHAATARDVVYCDPRRLAFVPVKTEAIWKESSQARSS